MRVRGPGINQGLGRMAESIQEGFATPPQRIPQRRFNQSPMRRAAMRRPRINWNGLGVNY